MILAYSPRAHALSPAHGPQTSSEAQSTGGSVRSRSTRAQCRQIRPTRDGIGVTWSLMQIADRTSCAALRARCGRRPCSRHGAMPAVPSRRQSTNWSRFGQIRRPQRTLTWPEATIAWTVVPSRELTGRSEARFWRVRALRGGYRRERRQPAARASAVVQNHRSPFEVSMRVWS